MAEKSMWGGRFAQGTAQSLQAYSESVSFDRRLYVVDIAGSKAHAAMLAKVGVLTAEEAGQIRDGLDAVQAEIESGQFVWRTELEDVHMNIESRLTELIGPLGGKLHTGRSRNDQVALDFRLYAAVRLLAWRELCARLVVVLTDIAEAHADTLMPGHTHLQPAQPVSLGHHMLAYVRMLMRDHERMGDCLSRTLVSPLGAAALAGTTYPLDPQAVADELGMGGVFANSLDAVSDRDFACEALFCASLAMTHLSRLCEEIILWANPGFGFVRLPDAYSTGSSIMPQKKNPDVCELMRGKVGRVNGALVGLLTTLKALPLAYNRDMQEDKEPFFDTDETVSASLAIMADMLAEMEFVPEAMERALSRGYLNATELADYLVGKGVPFREAHHAAGAAVALAERRGVGLEELPLDDLRTLNERIGEDVFTILPHRAAVARRVSPGSTGPDSVRAQIEAARAWLDSDG